MKLNQKIIDFVKSNMEADTKSLALNNRQLEAIDLKIALEQIESRQKIKAKLPTWYSNYELILPNKLFLEQSSSEITANFKSKLFPYDSSIDCTGGTGIDSFAFAKNSKSHLIVESNQYLADLLQHNSKVLQAENIEINNTDCLDFLSNNSKKFDLAYVDPSRRKSGRRVIKLEDMSPNLTELIAILKKLSDRILIKMSPLFDIDEILRLFENIESIHVVSVNDECKEILVSLSHNKNIELQIKAVELGANNPFMINANFFKANAQYDVPRKFIYEPNVALVKLGKHFDFESVYGIREIGVNSNLYTSDNLMKNFGGEIYKLLAITKVNLKELKAILGDKPRAMLKAKNFQIKTDELRKMLNLLEGDSYKIFAVVLTDGNKRLLICEKLSVS